MSEAKVRMIVVSCRAVDASKRATHSRAADLGGGYDCNFFFLLFLSGETQTSKNPGTQGWSMLCSRGGGASVSKGFVRARDYPRCFVRASKVECGRQ